VKQSTYGVSQAYTAGAIVATQKLDQNANSAVGDCKTTAYLPVAGFDDYYALSRTIDLVATKKTPVLFGVADINAPQTATFAFAGVGVVIDSSTQ
jgi:hypothetical protein